MPQTSLWCAAKAGWRKQPPASLIASHAWNGRDNRGRLWLRGIEGLSLWKCAPSATIQAMNALRFTTKSFSWACLKKNILTDRLNDAAGVGAEINRQ
jgi:hypothetical protein